MCEMLRHALDCLSVDAMGSAAPVPQWLIASLMAHGDSFIHHIWIRGLLSPCPTFGHTALLCGLLSGLSFCGGM